MKLVQILKEIKATPPTDWNRIEKIVIDDLEGWVGDIFEVDFEDIEDLPKQASVAVVQGFARITDELA